MLALRMDNRWLFAGLLSVALFLVLAALGSGLFTNSGHYINSWQHHFFNVLCHQDPSRSFAIHGTPMAVCSRCFGIYLFFATGVLLMPMYMLFRKISLKTEKKWLIAAILLNLADVLGNYFGFWSNTLITRFLLGGFLGIIPAFVLANEFFNIHK